MDIDFKTWGKRSRIFQNDLCEVSFLDLVPNQRCSWHTHKTKFNKFYVVEGEFYIMTEWGITDVPPGTTFLTKPDEFHEFRTGKNHGAKVIEVMYVKYDENDIHRDSLGGPIED